jgi:hypothetical protein
MNENVVAAIKKARELADKIVGSSSMGDGQRLAELFIHIDQQILSKMPTVGGKLAIIEGRREGHGV